MLTVDRVRCLYGPPQAMMNETRDDIMTLRVIRERDEVMVDDNDGRSKGTTNSHLICSPPVIICANPSHRLRLRGYYYIFK